MKYLAYLIVGLLVGGMSGMLGIGGGVLMVPVLIWLFSFEQRQAQGITLAVLALPVVLPGVWEYYTQELISKKDLAVAACIAVAFAIGTYTGASLQTLISVSVLRLLFGLLMLYIAVRFVVNSHSEATSAAAGLLTVVLAWVAYLGLRALGRRSLAPPELGTAIRGAHEPSCGQIDYFI
jgi:uncharacterized membrane protein YfcA